MPSDDVLAEALIVNLEFAQEPLDREANRLEDILEENDRFAQTDRSVKMQLLLEKLHDQLEALDDSACDLEKIGTIPPVEHAADDYSGMLVARVMQGSRDVLRRVLKDLGIDAIDFEWSGFSAGSTEWTIVFWSQLDPEEIIEAIWTTGIQWCRVEPYQNEDPEETQTEAYDSDEPWEEDEIEDEEEDDE